MKFRKMITATAGAQPIPATSCSSLHTVDRKLIMSEMQILTAEEKHVYTGKVKVYNYMTYIKVEVVTMDVF